MHVFPNPVTIVSTPAAINIRLYVILGISATKIYFICQANKILIFSDKIVTKYNVNVLLESIIVYKL